MEREEVARQRLVEYVLNAYHAPFSDNQHSIKLELKKRGYDKELDTIEEDWWRRTEFRRLPGVIQPKPLTAKGGW